MTYGGFSNIDNGKEKSQHTSEEEKNLNNDKGNETKDASCEVSLKDDIRKQPHLVGKRVNIMPEGLRKHS